MDWVLAAWPTMRPVMSFGFGLDIPKANGTGGRGWWCGCSWFCPILFGWRPFIHGSIIILSEVNYGRILVGHAGGRRGKSTTIGTRKSTTSAEVILASVQVCQWVWVICFFFFLSAFFFCFSLFFWVMIRKRRITKRWAKCLLIRPCETRLFLYWPASRCANGARFFTWFAGSTGRAECLSGFTS